MTAEELKVLDLIREDIQEIKQKVDSLLRQVSTISQTVTAHDVEITYLKRNRNSQAEDHKLVQHAIERANLAYRAFWIILSVVLGSTLGQLIPKFILK